jgi:N-acetylneuraminate lyase
MPNSSLRLRGMVAATFTPMRDDGSLNLDQIPVMVDQLIKQNIAAFYVLGSTGEGPSLAFDERREVAEAFVQAADKRIPVIVQVGSECLTQSAQLAEHAQRIGADAISAVSPVYFKPDSIDTLVASMARIARGAPDLPFYYYHIPAVTGITFDAIETLKAAEQLIPNFAGAKFTGPNVFEFQGCVEYAGDRLQLLWGLDEMLQYGLTAGAEAAVGSTYNFAAPLYARLLNAFAAGDTEAVRREQLRSQAIVRAFIPYGPRGAQKAIMKMVGRDCGPSRLPATSLTDQQYAALESDLREIGFFEWIQD